MGILVFATSLHVFAMNRDCARTQQVTISVVMQPSDVCLYASDHKLCFWILGNLAPISHECKSTLEHTYEAVYEVIRLVTRELPRKPTWLFLESVANMTRAGALPQLPPLGHTTQGGAGSVLRGSGRRLMWPTPRAEFSTINF